MEKDIELLNECFNTWLSGVTMRQRRRRYKDFAYGRQWGDTYRDASGRILSEGQALIESGRIPITNNLIRQLIKSIVGRYRYMMRGRDGESEPIGLSGALISGEKIDDIDARALEEFLISGCVVQRLGSDREEMPEVENVSPERIFYHRFESADASDCRLIGALHALPMATLMRRFSQGDVDRANLIRSIYQQRERGRVIQGERAEAEDFSETDIHGRYRVIEVWEKREIEMLRCHDYSDASYWVMPYTEENYNWLIKSNREREEHGVPQIVYSLDLVDRWQSTWLTPHGVVLERRVTAEGDVHPYVIKFYPLIDGEVHSLVEDVIDQQKYVNRLITLLDDIIASSAKGVLLYPTDQLPEGFTWRDLRRVWSNPSGIIPYKRTSSNVTPEQISNPGTSAGASDMLRLQLQLFDEISGTSGAMRGKSSNATGVAMLHTELENGIISLLDILASFRGFVDMRNARLNECRKGKTGEV